MDYKKIELQSKRELLKKSLHLPQVFINYGYSDRYISDAFLNSSGSFKLDYSMEGLVFNENGLTRGEIELLFQAYSTVVFKTVEFLDPTKIIGRTRTGETEKYIPSREIIEDLK